MALYNDMTAVAKAKHYISTHKSFNEKDLLDYIGVSNHNKLTKAITSCCGGYASEAKWKQVNGERERVRTNATIKPSIDLFEYTQVLMNMQ